MVIENKEARLATIGGPTGQGSHLRLFPGKTTLTKAEEKVWAEAKKKKSVADRIKRGVFVEHKPAQKPVTVKTEKKEG